MLTRETMLIHITMDGLPLGPVALWATLICGLRTVHIRSWHPLLMLLLLMELASVLRLCIHAGLRLLLLVVVVVVVLLLLLVLVLPLGLSLGWTWLWTRFWIRLKSCCVSIAAASSNWFRLF